MTATPVDVVLFDLGGVLTEFDGTAALAQLTGRTEAEVLRRWLRSPAVRRFEAGACTPEEFAADAVTEWSLPMTGAEFLEAFRGWLRDPADGAEQLVREVAERATVGCLSNTNAAHWEAVIGRWPLLDAFRHRFLSFELGLLKPDAAIFEYVTDTLPVQAGRILFLDDNPLNVEAAVVAGLQAREVRGLTQARSALRERRLVD